MNKAAVNHHKAHKPRQWPTGARSPRVGVPSSGVRHGPAARVAGARGVGRPRGCNFPHVRESLNWTLRRYVRASSLRVSLRRQAPRDRRHARAGRPEPPPPGRRPAGRGGRGSRLAGTRGAGDRRVAVHGSRAAVPYPQKPTNGTFDPGCGKPSRRCSARCGYHYARAPCPPGPAINYFKLQNMCIE